MAQAKIHRTAIRSALLTGAVLIGGMAAARADSFIASPQDYPSPQAYAAAYAAANQEGPAIQDKVWNPNAYQCGVNCPVMTAIERRVYTDRLGGDAGGGDDTGND